MKTEANIFIFRRDMRIHDNIGLSQCIAQCKQYDIAFLPIFIFNPKQIDKTTNEYFSDFTVHFMIESLNSLANELKGMGSRLYTFYGSDEYIINILYKMFKINSIFFNFDYSPFARDRDTRLLTLCSMKNISGYGIWNEYSLLSIQEMIKPYKVFGAFYKKYCNASIKKPTETNMKSVKSITTNIHQSLSSDSWNRFYDSKKTVTKTLIGGRTQALHILSLIKQGYFKNYGIERDYPSLDKTTHLSAYLKYGCISIREAYWAIRNAYGISHPLLRELFWRTYYEQITYWFPHTLQGMTSTKPNNPLPQKHYKWHYNKNIMSAVKNACTGIPIIDASLRCLYSTGFMHNRLRMVLCMYLVRHLKQDWRIYEKWFATNIIDYYPPSNRGGWEWAVLYRFELSPWAQAKSYDKDCVFIRKWLPELEPVVDTDIHNWLNMYHKYKIYHKPIWYRK